MSRPYISAGIEELGGIFTASRDNPHVLKQLQEELQHRSTKRAKALLARVKRQLETLQNDGSGDDPPSAVQPESRPKGPPKKPPLGPASGEPLQDDYSHPDDQKKPHRLVPIRPPGTSGLPDPMPPRIRDGPTLQIAKDADLPDRFAAALNALIAEIKKKGSGQKQYKLDKGVRSESPGQEYIYSFVFTDEADLFEEAQVELQVSDRRVQGSIVSISAGKLVIAVKEDLGASIPKAFLVIDATALLVALVEKLDQVKKGEIILNRSSVVGFRPEPPAPVALKGRLTRQAAGGLNEAQIRAYERSLTAAVAWIWGPPGTGKTKTLGEVVRSAFENDRRVLVCSNTNKAVDQVVWEVCKALGTDHIAMEEGRVVWLGRIVDDKLRDSFADYVTVDGIIERRSKELVARRRQLEEDIKRIDAQTEHIQGILASFEALDRAENEVTDHQAASNKIAQDVRSAKNQLSQVDAKLPKLAEELQRRRKGGFMRIFKRSEETIQRDIRATEAARSKTEAKLAALNTSYSNARLQFDDAVAVQDRMRAELATKDRAQLKEQMKDAQERRDSAVTEHREIEGKLAAIRGSVVREARILGTTCTKAYLSAREIGQVEMVVIDEASMVMLPVSWFVAGLSSERVVVSGDFRQIPPIVQSNQKEVLEILAKDAFTASGVIGDETRLVMLDTQYRMDDAICSLVSKPMYQGRLLTAPRPAYESAVPNLFNQPLTIIDTSDLWPFESQSPSFSRFNLMHALLARNLAWHFHREGALQQKTDLGICTPYSAQARTVQKLLEGEDLDELVYVGTVHRYQGDERKTILLDIPESHGGAWTVGRFVQGVPPEDIGARLINVAVSRAQEHLIVMANLTYLDGKLPSGSLLRSILFEMQEHGSVVRGEDVLKLRPISHDLKGLIGQMPFEEITETLGIFDEATFERAIEHDINAATESVVIFSGYVTPSRVGKLGDLFRSKIAEGVKVRCVTRPPQRNGSIPRELGRDALNMLEGIGVTVDCRAAIHQKICLIDSKIVWLRSLNALSHAGRSDETMTRAVNEGYARVVAGHMSKRRISSEKAAEAVADAENPRCPECGSRTVYAEGRYGPYYFCESECGWKKNQRSLERTASRRKVPNAGQATDLPDKGAACPKCGSETRLRSGRFGPFYGCVNYPRCKGKRRVK